jgi:hypothetical protein
MGDDWLNGFGLIIVTGKVGPEGDSGDLLGENKIPE